MHSRNTATLAWDLCRRFGLEPDLGYLAGVAHDLAKPCGGAELMHIVKHDGLGLSKLEKNKPSLLHGRAAAVLMKEHFGIHNKDVLEAVACHTSGRVNMGPLAKIVYIADKIEVSRQRADPGLRKMCHEEKDLEDIFSAVLNENVSWLRSKKADLSEETFRLLEKMKGKNH
jgi:nicotinate-nucleotide adenylyltransferase